MPTNLMPSNQALNMVCNTKKPKSNNSNPQSLKP